MSGADKSGGDGKREILRPGDSLQDHSDDPTDRAEAAARAARRALDEQERRRQEEQRQQHAEAERKLGWHGRLWRKLRAVGQSLAAPLAAVGAFFTKRLPRTSARAAGAFMFVVRLIENYVWPAVRAISLKTDAKGERTLTLAGRALIATAVFLVIWPFFKIFYVLGTTRDFHKVHITFKQIITHDRYLVFGDYTDAQGIRENMAFNITDSWVYWNWAPDLMFAQVPTVGKCDFRTYGWYLRVPRFVPFVGRTLLVEPVVIEAKCAEANLGNGPSQ
ncbi:MAG: hypothetical protein KBA31_09330 [Alphaproteobacteria bacterium]|nr:hypothetical protein [Alphaproteobacteria bacterium]